jgi:hypothetical protein
MAPRPPSGHNAGGSDPARRRRGAMTTGEPRQGKSVGVVEEEERKL